jgi:uncharacterized protein (UPF0218 family)
MEKTIIGKTFCLPDIMRKEMRKQYGVLYPGNAEETTQQILHDMGSPSKLISIGDITTFNIIKCGTIPDISVVDEKTHRKPVDIDIVKGIRHSNFKTIHVANPAGCVTRNLVSALSKAMDCDAPVQIMVNGEEDLAALPAIVLAPPSSVVIYGLPNKGAILVTVTSGIKDQICSMLERMRCEET